MEHAERAKRIGAQVTFHRLMADTTMPPPKKTPHKEEMTPEEGPQRAPRFHDKNATPKKSILKDTRSSDSKRRRGRMLAWPDFHGKALYSVVEFVERYEYDSVHSHPRAVSLVASHLIVCDCSD